MRAALLTTVLLILAGPGAAGDVKPWGSLQGKIVWRGPLPEVKSFENQIREKPEAKYYLNSPKEHLLDPTWRVDPKSRGVANVVVLLRAAKMPLPIRDEDRKRSDTIVLDVPYCNYQPHVVALYPEWSEQNRTGQRFYITCTSKEGPGFFFGLRGNPDRNSGNWMMAPGQKTEVFLRPQKTAIVVEDILRPWMKAFIWVFDHPYFAISKSDGSFELPRVPAGMELKVIAWHEARGWLFGRDGKLMSFQSKSNQLDVEMQGEQATDGASK